MYLNRILAILVTLIQLNLMSPISNGSQSLFLRKSARLTDYLAEGEHSLNDDESLNKVIDDIFEASNDDQTNSQFDKKPSPRTRTILLPCWSGPKCPSALISIMIADK